MTLQEEIDKKLSQLYYYDPDELGEDAFKPLGDDEKQELQALYRTRLEKEMLEIIEGAKPEPHLLGCDKHWSDDSNGTCACDENERAYRRGVNDYHTQLLNIIKGGK